MRTKFYPENLKETENLEERDVNGITLLWRRLNSWGFKIVLINSNCITWENILGFVKAKDEYEKRMGIWGAVSATIRGFLSVTALELKATGFARMTVLRVVI
jgi:hypothetical protein